MKTILAPGTFFEQLYLEEETDSIFRLQEENRKFENSFKSYASPVIDKKTNKWLIFRKICLKRAHITRL